MRQRTIMTVECAEAIGVAFAGGASLNRPRLRCGNVGFPFGFGRPVSDRVHGLSDVLGLLLARAGSWLATRQPSDRRTYGYRRASILAALANAALLLTATGGLIVEAVQRLFDAQPVASGMVLWVASVAIAVNLGTALLFMRGRESDINIRGAFLHLMADAAVSLGVVIAALLISKTGWLWLDPVASLGVALVVLASGWGLMRSALDLALDAVPPGVDRSAVEDYLAGLPGVTEVHDLHIWGMSTTETALTAHLVRPGALPDDALLDQIAQELERQFHIHHVTIQLENGALACRYAPAHVV